MFNVLETVADPTADAAGKLTTMIQAQNFGEVTTVILAGVGAVLGVVITVNIIKKGLNAVFKYFNKATI